MRRRFRWKLARKLKRRSTCTECKASRRAPLCPFSSHGDRRESTWLRRELDARTHSFRPTLSSLPSPSPSSTLELTHSTPSWSRNGFDSWSAEPCWLAPSSSSRPPPPSPRGQAGLSPRPNGHSRPSNALPTRSLPRLSRLSSTFLPSHLLLCSPLSLLPPRLKLLSQNRRPAVPGPAPPPTSSTSLRTRGQHPKHPPQTRATSPTSPIQASTTSGRTSLLQSLPTADPRRRISLTNGLVLAKLLNRTLLVPAVTLGRAVDWSTGTGGNLQEQLELAEHAPIAECRQMTDHDQRRDKVRSLRTELGE